MAKTMLLTLIEKYYKRGEISVFANLSLSHKEFGAIQTRKIRLCGPPKRSLKTRLAFLACLPLAAQGSVGHTVAGLPQELWGLKLVVWPISAHILVAGLPRSCGIETYASHNLALPISHGCRTTPELWGLKHYGKHGVAFFGRVAGLPRRCGDGKR